MKLGRQKFARLAEETAKLTNEIEKLSAQCEAYKDAMLFAQDIATMARLAYWGSPRAKEEVQEIIDRHSKGQGIWHKWDRTMEDLESGKAMRRILAKQIA